MPPVSPEILLLLENINKQIQQNSTLQETNRNFMQSQIDAMNTAIKQVEEKNNEAMKTYVEEKIRMVDKDITELKKQLEEVKQTILDKQEERYKVMIRVQASIIFLVLGAIVTILTKIIFNV